MSIILGIISVIKFLLIILLCVVLLILALLLVVLFVPVVYDADFSYEDQINAQVNVSWLFRAVQLSYDIREGNKNLGIKVLFFDLTGKNTGKRIKTKKQEYSRAAYDENISQYQEHKGESAEQADFDDLSELDDYENQNEKAKKPRKSKQRIQKNRNDKNVKSLKRDIDKDSEKDIDKETEKETEETNGLLSKINNYIDKAKYYLNHPDKDKLISLAIKLIKRIAKALKPRKINLDALVGFEDPSLTGYALGIAGITIGIMGLTGSNYNVSVNGNFDKKVLSLKAAAAGNLTVWSFIWPLAAFALSKPVFKILIKYITSGKDEKNEQ